MLGLQAGVPIETPALTVNRLCGSGMQSLVSAAQMIQLAKRTTVLAGGMESMSQAPHVIRGMRWGVGLGEGKLEDSLMVALLDSYCGLYMANTAELYAEQQGITREMQDEFAYRSQRLAGEAQKACRLSEEITPVPLRNKKGEATGEMFAADDHLRPETTLEALQKLRPSFGKNGTVTAGNASGIVDGGAATVLMKMDDAQKRGLKPLGRIVSWGIAGVDPKIMGSGPVPASRAALKKAGTEARGYRSDRSERGVRGAVSGGRKRVGIGSREGEREWRRDRAGASAGRDGDEAGDHAVA